MNRFSALVNELENSQRLVEGAWEQISSVQVLQKEEKQSVQGLLEEAIESLKAARVFGRACANAVQLVDSGRRQRVTYAGGGVSNHPAGQHFAPQRKREHGL